MGHSEQELESVVGQQGKELYHELGYFLERRVPRLLQVIEEKIRPAVIEARNAVGKYRQVAPAYFAAGRGHLETAREVLKEKRTFYAGIYEDELSGVLGAFSSLSDGEKKKATEGLQNFLAAIDNLLAAIDETIGVAKKVTVGDARVVNMRDWVVKYFPKKRAA